MRRSTALLLAAAAVLAWLALAALFPRRAHPAPPAQGPEPARSVTELAPVDGPGRRAAGVAGTLAPGAFYSLPEGRSFELEFAGSFTAEVSGGGTSGARIELALDGTMSVLVLRAAENEIVLRSSLALERVRVTAAGTAARADEEAALAGELAGPVLVRMDTRGRILGLAFDQGARREAKNVVRTLWSAARFAIEPEQDRWSVEEADPSGTCLMEYEWSGAVDAAAERGIVRTKLSYPGLALAPRILASRCEGRMSVELRWARESRWEERVELPLDGSGSSVRVESLLSFALVRHGLMARASLPPLEEPIAWEDAAGRPSTTHALHLSRELALAAETATLEALLATLEAQLGRDLLESPELHDTQRLLAELVRRDAGNLARLRALLHGLDSRAGMVVLAAVALAQTPEAQAFLAGILGDENERDELRLHANLALHQITRPSRELLEALAGVLQSPASARSVRSSALLALGTLAGRAEPGLAGEALALLIARPGLGESTDDLVLWLEALGNTGSPAILAAVLASLDHPDERVRASGVAALRHQESGEEHLIAALTDPSLRVRTAAAEELAQRSTPEAGRAVERFLSSESNARARERAVAAFGRRSALDEPARALLLRVSARDTDPAVRRLALRVLREG